MRDVENIRDLTELHPDYIGLIFYAPSKRFVNITDTKILPDIPEDVKLTGVFVNESLENVLRKISLFKLQAVQLHGDESEEYCLSLRQQTNNIQIIKAFGVDDEFDFMNVEPYLAVTDFFLFDTNTKGHGGSGKSFNWAMLEKYPFSQPYFLSGGISPENFAEVLNINDERLYAVDLNSRFETQAGVKDIYALKKIVKLLKPQSQQEDI